MQSISNRWIKSGLVWLLITMGYGMYAGITQQFHLSSSHAHAGLLGGVWAILFAWLYSRQPEEARARFAGIQWALFNLGVLAQVLALYMVMNFGGMWGMAIGVSGLLILGSTIWIITSVWPRSTG